MVTSTHEALIRAIQEDPPILARLFQEIGVQMPETKSIGMVSVDATEVLPVERRIDAVARFETVHQGEFLMLIEIQRAKDPTKPSTWLYYQAYMKERHKIPATLVVLCTDPGVGHWAAEPHWFGPQFARTAMLHPVVLSTANIPRITNVDDAERDIPLATLSVVVHVDDDDHSLMMRALCVALRDRTPQFDVLLWNDLVEQGLGRSPAAALWRQMMGNDLDRLQGPTAQLLRTQCREEGREEGRAQQCARNILALLKARGVEVSEADRERVLGCADAEVLEAWFIRAVQVAKPDELWHADHVVAQRTEEEFDGTRSLDA